jgi:hypothetical protein
MKNSKQYQGKNPIPGPKPFGIAKGGTAVATPAANAAVVVAKVDAPVDADAAARAAVAITSIDAKVDAKPDANVVIAAAVPPVVEAAAQPLASTPARVDPLDNVKSGEQILADMAKPAASTRPKS